MSFWPTFLSGTSDADTIDEEILNPYKWVIVRSFSGDDSILLNVDVKSLSIWSGDGADSVDVTGSADALIVDSGKGDDNVNLSGDFTYGLVVTGSGDDTVNIDTSGNYLVVKTGGGDDTINIQSDSTDMDARWIKGGSGTDTVNYQALDVGVTVNLMDQSQNNGGATNDILKSIENITGTQEDDNITGSKKDNVLKGLGGDDILSGKDGDDILEGGAGSDILNGGAGADMLFGVSNNAAAGSFQQTFGLFLVDLDPFTGNVSEGTIDGWSITLTDINGIQYVENFGPEDINDAIPQDGGAIADDFAFQTITLEGVAPNEIVDINVTIHNLNHDDINHVFATFFAFDVTGNLANGLPDGLLLQTPLIDPAYDLGGQNGITLTFDDQAVEPFLGTNYTPGGSYTTASGVPLNGMINGNGGFFPDPGNMPIEEEPVDTATYEDSDAGVTIDLSVVDMDGFSVGSGGHAEGDKLIDIQNLIGSKYNDTLIGNDKDNKLEGGDGDDLLVGGLGENILVGGQGADMLLARQNIPDFQATYLLSLFDFDVFTNESNEGFLGSWTLTFTDINNNQYTFAMPGKPISDGEVSETGEISDPNPLMAEIHIPVPENEIIDVNVTFDDLSSDMLANVAVDLSVMKEDVVLNVAYFDLLQLGAINEISVTFDDQALQSLNEANYVENGSYTLGLAELNDLIELSGTSNSVADYTDSSTGINIDLSVTDVDGYSHGTGGDAQGDMLKGINDINGSQGHDVISGNDQNNRIDGSDGNDILNGNDGDDYLIAGPGIDQLNGGDGVDFLEISSLSDIVDGGNDIDVVVMENVAPIGAPDVILPIPAALLQQLNDALLEINDPFVTSEIANYSSTYTIDGVAYDLQNDTLFANIEGISGSQNNDFLIHDTLANGFSYLDNPDFDPTSEGIIPANVQGYFIQGGGGNDVLVGSDGNDVIFGNYFISSDAPSAQPFSQLPLDEALEFDRPSNIAIGGAGDDFIGVDIHYIDQIDAILRGEISVSDITDAGTAPGYDVVAPAYSLAYGGMGNDTIFCNCTDLGMCLTFAGEGDDEVICPCPVGSSIAFLGTGNDRYDCRSQQAGTFHIIYGEDGNDDIRVYAVVAGVTFVDGGIGNDVITILDAGGTDAKVYAGDGDDTIRAQGSEFAIIDGGTGIDTLVLQFYDYALDMNAEVDLTAANPFIDGMMVDNNIDVNDLDASYNLVNVEQAVADNLNFHGTAANESVIIDDSWMPSGPFSPEGGYTFNGQGGTDTLHIQDVVMLSIDQLAGIKGINIINLDDLASQTLDIFSFDMSSLADLISEVSLNDLYENNVPQSLELTIDGGAEDTVNLQGAVADAPMGGYDVYLMSDGFFDVAINIDQDVNVNLLA